MVQRQARPVSEYVLESSRAARRPEPDTSVPEAQVIQMVPEPKVQPFPTLDFENALQVATAANRAITAAKLTALIDAADAYADTLAPGVTATLPAGEYPLGVSEVAIPIRVIHYLQDAGAAVRSIAIPNAAEPDKSVPLGSPDGIATAGDGTTLNEIQFLADGLTDTMLYVSDTVTLETPLTTLLQFQGAVVVNGAISVNAATEFLGWHNRMGDKFVPLGQTLYTPIAATAAQVADAANFDVVYSRWPALTANGKVNIKNSAADKGGPVHIEGGVYSVAESHFHKSRSP